MLEFSPMPASVQTFPSDYLAATEAVAYYPVPNPGLLLFSGETRRVYLQRQTTNDIDLLTPFRALPNLLTAPTGRILEYFTLLELEDGIAMLTQPGHGPGLATYFQKRIFFNDKVGIQDWSPNWLQIELHGPNAPKLLTQFNFAYAPEQDAVIEAEWQGVRLRVLGIPGFGGAPGFLLIIPSALSNYITTQLVSYPSLSMATHEILRIESTQPGPPEFSAEATPFELDLDHLVSTTKGCYTGQEILARQVTYDKVVRRLVRLQAHEPLLAGANLFADGKAVGQITSAAISPRMGPIALAIVRKPYDASENELVMQGKLGSVTAQVVD